MKSQMNLDSNGFLAGATVKASAGELVFSSTNDLRYSSSSARMVQAKMWDVNKFEEGNR